MNAIQNKTATSAPKISSRTAWIVLLASAVLEAVWATALGASEGFSLGVPTIIFGAALIASMIGLSIAMGAIPMGTAYAVWVGVGAALTVSFAMVTGTEGASPLKIVFLAGIVGCVIGLKMAKDPSPTSE